MGDEEEERLELIGRGSLGGQAAGGAPELGDPQRRLGTASSKNSLANLADAV